MRNNQRTLVVSIYDDSDVPVTGVVCGWRDEDICLVRWDGTDGEPKPVPMDELMPVNRPGPRSYTDVDTYVSTDLRAIATGHGDLLDELRRLRFIRDTADNELRVLIALGRQFIHPRPYTLQALADAAGMSVSGIRTCTTMRHTAHVRDVLGNAVILWKDTNRS